MPDIRTVWLTDSGFTGWQEAGHDLSAGDDIETSVLLSLFSDRRAAPDDVTDDGERRGWWGDTGSEISLGSRLWMLRRSVLSAAVAANAEFYAKESLMWLVDDGVLSDVSVTAVIRWPDRLILNVNLFWPNDNRQEYSFRWLWGENNALPETNTQ
ncbi:phage GP46 family protein [Tatumella saanichensis]|uniref:phage GP46 family protein n=1 Tax=Tatumella saanichensis TaxID=480813 RepID=UPI0004A4DC18|nr:phage GP46 family protein [Tatumella saanichensis]